jgi:hypothetical protein
MMVEHFCRLTICRHTLNATVLQLHTHLTGERASYVMAMS